MSARVGSTLLMRLLATSAAVVCDRVPPYEHRYLAYLAHTARAIGTPWERGRDWQPSELLGGALGSFGPLPFVAESVAVDDLGRRSLAHLWEAFSASARERAPAARYYAEKLAGPLQPLAEAGIPLTLLDLVRDPRDVFVSLRAFSEQLGTGISGWRLGHPDAANLPFFIAALDERLGALGRHTGGVTPLVVRYEDLVLDGPATAARIGAALGLELDLTLAATDAAIRGQMTVAAADESIGRWRRELDPDVAATIGRLLADQIERCGYEPS